MKTIYLFIILLQAFITGCIRKPSQVEVRDRQLFVNDQPYYIKGVCYNPVDIGQTTRSFASLSSDIALMQEAGVNTIRVYQPIDDDAILSQLHENGISVIISFGFNQSGFYDILSGSYLDYIRAYKNHPAILFWELGNEYNYHPEWFQDDIQNWYNELENAASAIHLLDPNHPVASAHGDVPLLHVLTSCPSVDIWGLNVYRWDKPSSVFAEWEAISTKPIYFAEAGADSYMSVAAEGYVQGANEQAQADATHAILTQILDDKHSCIGVTLFSFVDEWWKAGDPLKQDAGGFAPSSTGVPYDGDANEEFWGVVDIHRNKKASYHVVKTHFLEVQQ